MKRSTPELVFDGNATIGEGPIWEPVSRRLVWVDIPAGAVHVLDPSSGHDQAFQMGQSVGVAVLGPEGTLVVACADGFYALEIRSGKSTLLAHVEADDADTRMNDGACDAVGRLWAGTMSDRAIPGAGSLYRFDADRIVTKVLSGLTISNGLGWSPDDSTMYYIDSPTQSIDTFEFNLRLGTIGNRRHLVSIEKADGMPDGLAVDAEGCVWVALWGGGAVRRYDPNGVLITQFELPVEFVSSCGFGGDHLEDLYVTTARYTLSSESLAKQPGAGGIFRLRPGVRGRRAKPWAGSFRHLNRGTLARAKGG